MISRIVSFALAQRFIIVMAALGVVVWGIISVPAICRSTLIPIFLHRTWKSLRSGQVMRRRKWSAAFPFPLESGDTNGIPKIDALRSISLYGLSAIEMNFDYATDPYFAREQASSAWPMRHCRTGSRRVYRLCSAPAD